MRFLSLISLASLILSGFSSENELFACDKCGRYSSAPPMRYVSATPVSYAYSAPVYGFSPVLGSSMYYSDVSAFPVHNFGVSHSQVQNFGVSDIISILGLADKLLGGGGTPAPTADPSIDKKLDDLNARADKIHQLLESRTVKNTEAIAKIAENQGRIAKAVQTNTELIEKNLEAIELLQQKLAEQPTP